MHRRLALGIIKPRRGGYGYWTQLMLVMVGIATCAAMAAQPSQHGALPAQRLLASRVGLAACPASDLDCRAFTGTLEWQPDESRPMLSTRGLHRLALLQGLNARQREHALRCLAVIAWAEARSDGVAGMHGVIAVVLNRTRHPAYSRDPCQVIGQDAAFEPLGQSAYHAIATRLRLGALIPFPRPDSAVDREALHTARLLVWNLALKRKLADPTDGATHFLAPAVIAARGQQMPLWANLLEPTVRIGGHQFYRNPVRLAESR